MNDDCQFGHVADPEDTTGDVWALDDDGVLPREACASPPTRVGTTPHELYDRDYVYRIGPRANVDAHTCAHCNVALTLPRLDDDDAARRMRPVLSELLCLPCLQHALLHGVCPHCWGRIEMGPRCVGNHHMTVLAAV